MTPYKMSFKAIKKRITKALAPIKSGDPIAYIFFASDVPPPDSNEPVELLLGLYGRNDRIAASITEAMVESPLMYELVMMAVNDAHQRLNEERKENEQRKRV